jgi:hypothetical protein
MARYIADNITERIRSQLYNLNLTEDDEGYVDPETISVWPYAIYYPYYEQYIYIVDDAIAQMGVCLIPGYYKSHFMFIY